MIYFCTYFDSNYLINGLALYRSLVRHATPFRLWVLCFDDFVCEVLKKLRLPEVVPIPLREFEEGDKELLQAKGNRSRTEYYFTCTPSLPLYILRNHPQVDRITYLDADLLFFSDPSPIYQELGSGSVLIIGHHFLPHLKYLEDRGIYNVGLLSFQRDNIGFQCLHWWRDKCLKWCYDRVEDGRFADQKYLDDWPTRFPGVVVLQHKGVGLAPWNAGNYSLRLEKGNVLVDLQLLVLFHFHGLKQIKRWLYDLNLAGYGVNANSLLRQHIYGPYVRELQEVACWLSASSLVNGFHISMCSIRGRSVKSNIFLRKALQIKQQLSIIKKLFQGDLLLVIRGRVL